MNYRLNHQGQELGVLTLEELRRRRAAGELTGSEWVLPEGASEWKALDSVLQAASRGLRPGPPPLPPSATKKKSNSIVVLAVSAAVFLFLVGGTLVGIFAYRFVKQ